MKSRVGLMFCHRLTKPYTCSLVISEQTMPNYPLNFVCVCTDRYPIKYAEILIKRFKDATKLDFNYYCITDRPDEITDWATPLAPFKKAEGWWNKCNLFSEDMPKGICLYMDIDIVIMNNFDEEILWTIENMNSIACVSDAIHWMGEKFSSSMMIFKSGENAEIFDNFSAHYAELASREGGDQVWIGPQLQNILFIDEKFPHLKLNLKFHIAKREGNQLHLPQALAPSVKLVDCGGNPKPDQLGNVPYIKENWHDYIHA